MFLDFVFINPRNITTQFKVYAKEQVLMSISLIFENRFEVTFEFQKYICLCYGIASLFQEQAPPLVYFR